MANFYARRRRSNTIWTVLSLAATGFGLTWLVLILAALLWNGLRWALAIGFIGGLFPALRAARMPVTSGLREL